MDNETDVILERYERVLGLFLASGEELNASLMELRKKGIYKSPTSSLRFPLPDERDGVTHKVEIGAEPKKFEGYITTGVYSDGEIGEVFLEAEKEGSFVSGIIDAFAVVFSLSLQYGVPLQHVVDKLKNSRFEPDGFTNNQDIHHAHSVVDYLMKWLESNYLYGEKKADDGSAS